jgi:hypothetical protein
MTLRADVVRAYQIDRPYGGEQPFAAMVVITSLGAATDAIDSRGMRTARGEQSSQHRSAGSQDTGPGGGFDCFQIRFALSLTGEDYLEERLDFACDFVMNGKSRFFSSSVQPALGGSAGRSRQICSLTAVS